ncbi:MAG TPA: PhoU domain-containing protein [Acidimicrobiales bacterium]|nr:PhoU domain-containing protein [Acidimicrobiales bacterium]
MFGELEGQSEIDRSVVRLFALVSEGLAQATHALLAGERDTALGVIEREQRVNALVGEVEAMVWAEIEGDRPQRDLRHLVGLLLILPELERSADLAEHIAQRAVNSLGWQMSPLSRGIVQRMTEVALEMWGSVAGLFVDPSTVGVDLSEDDEELDLLHDRLTAEIALGEMAPEVASQVTLLARFYERLGDHAVNLSRRIVLLSDGEGDAPPAEDP